MKNKSIAKNYSYYLIYQVLTIVLPIFTTPYLARTLGAEALGIYGYTLSIVTYFVMMAALGISRYGEREIAYVQDDRKKKSQIFWELNFVRFIMTLIFSILFVLIFCINNKYAFYYRILIFELISVALDIAWLFQGEEEFKKIVFRNSIVKIGGVILTFLLIKSQNDLKIYFCIYVISNFLANASLWIKINKYIDFVKIDFKRALRHIKPMFVLFLPQIAMSVYTVLDKTMLGNISKNIVNVGYYEQAQKIVKIALAFVTNLSAIMVPRISYIYANGNLNQINAYMKKSFQFNWMLGLPIMFGIIAITNNFVPWFFGDGYDAVKILLIFFSPIVIFKTFNTTIGEQYLVATKKQNAYTVFIIIGSILNIIMNILLIPKLNALGAIISTIISECFIFISEVTYIHHKKYINIDNIFTGISKYVFSSLIMFLIILFISIKMPIGFFYTIVEIFIGIVIYFVLLIIMKDESIYYLLNKGKYLFKRKVKK